MYKRQGHIRAGKNPLLEYAAPEARRRLRALDVYKRQLKYGGPIDGHDVAALERALRDAAAYRGPVVIHVVTNKGNGYAPAVRDDIDKYHGVSTFDPKDGSFAIKAPSWTDLFGDALLEAAEKDTRIVAITAAMASSTGLLAFAERFPDRFFDVGIAEQHAVTFAAGLAMNCLLYTSRCV